jgi:shikimate dehydrogenase
MSRIHAEVIGDPIDHSKSPLIHNFWLGKLGLDAEYHACRVPPGELADYARRRRAVAEWRGCNVTIPHKQAIIPLVDEVEVGAAAIGAVNTVYRLADGRLGGANTDVDGVVEAIGPTVLPGRDAAVIGAGGAARAAFAFLARQGCASVRVLARNPDKAAQAAKDCGLAAEVLPFAARSGALDGAALLINATQQGMAGQDPMPGFVLEELAGMAAGALVFDMVYAPLETELLATARKLGLRTADGLLMLVGQAATAFELFFGQAPPRQHDAELRALLTS